AYGCRDVVIIAHSGGTMVSLTTLTDPAFAGLRVEKLITIGEALNLGWRVHHPNPPPPPPPPPTRRPGPRRPATGGPATSAGSSRTCSGATSGAPTTRRHPAGRSCRGI